MLAPWKESYDQPRQNIKKQRHYFANKCPSSQTYGFTVVMYRCESWTIKKVECWRIDAFELWCWRRLLRVPWPARISNQSFLKEISLERSLEKLMLMLKLQYFSHLIRRTLIWKDPDTGKDWRQEEKGWQKMRWLDGITDSMDMKERKWSGSVIHLCVWLFATPWTVAYQSLCPWDFPGISTRVDCHFLLQGIFLTRGSNPGLLHCRQMLYHLSHQGSHQWTWVWVYSRSWWWTGKPGVLQSMGSQSVRLNWTELNLHHLLWSL